MRIMVDTNLWISYLLPSARQGRTIDHLFDLVVEGAVRLVVPTELLREIRDTVVTKPRLARRIHPDDVQELIAVLESIGEVVPDLDEPIPRITRDPKDDYLLAHAMLEDVDVLISGDAHLLSHAPLVDRPRIMSAREFLDALSTST